MISMENWNTQAVEKLNTEKKSVAGQKENVMSGAVLSALKDFCRQDAAGVGNSISDLDAYKKAVQFYFPGAEVRMQLTIDLIGQAAGEDKPQTDSAEDLSKTISLDLADFFG